MARPAPDTKKRTVPGLRFARGVRMRTGIEQARLDLAKWEARVADDTAALAAAAAALLVADVRSESVCTRSAAVATTSSPVCTRSAAVATASAWASSALALTLVATADISVPNVGSAALQG